MRGVGVYARMVPSNGLVSHLGCISSLSPVVKDWVGNRCDSNQDEVRITDA